MATKPKYYIVEASALPEVFLKVAEAKRLLSTGEVSTGNEAARRTGISRSAFYTCRDSVLHDEPGVLSAILAAFAMCGANILTINQTIPSGGCAAVTVTAETMSMKGSIEELLHRLRETVGVVKAEILAG